MSDNSNKNKNNKNNPNAYQEFMPYWKKEEECFENETIMAEVTDLKGRTKTESVSYPRAKPTEQILYENFMSKITSGVTGEFYFQRDKAGNQVHQKDGVNARYIVHTIVRVKRPDGSEWLYSQGRIEGFDSLGSPVGHSISAPEKWAKTDFAHTRRYDAKKEIIVEECSGPANVTEVYELPYTPENVQQLYDQSVNGLKEKAIPFQIGPNPGDVQFLVKPEDKDINVVIKWSSIDESLKLFKTKDFEFLFNGDFIPPQVKAEAQAKSMALINSKNDPETAEDIIASRRRLEKDNKNYKGYML